MYARVDLEIEGRQNVLLVPKIALVDSEGRRGVYQPSEDNRATFKPVQVGIEDAERAEILDGLHEGETVVSVGAGALRRNDQLVVAGQGGDQQRGPGGAGGPGGRPGMGRQRGQGGPGGPGGAGTGQAPDGQRGRRPPSQQ
jgi:hypothetical protein